MGEKRHRKERKENKRRKMLDNLWQSIEKARKGAQRRRGKEIKLMKKEGYS